MIDTELPTLDEFVDLDTLAASVSSTFPTPDSIRWFVRQNRACLVERGALIVVTGRMRFHPAMFKRATVEIGQKAAV